MNNNLDQTSKDIKKKAMQEFLNSVEILKLKDVNVIILDKQKDQELKGINIPDAVFPNWFTTYENGTLALF